MNETNTDFKEHLDNLCGKPEFVMVYQLLKKRGKHKKGTLFVLCQNIAFYTIKKYYSPSKIPSFQTCPYKDKSIKFYGYFQSRGVPVCKALLWEIKNKPYPVWPVID